MAVTQMQLAQTQLEVMSAIATLGSLEMDLTAQVCAHWTLLLLGIDGNKCVTNTYVHCFVLYRHQ